MPRVGGEPAEGVQAVVLTLRILEHLADHDEVGVTALADALGTTKSRIHRHLQTLVAHRYVSRSPETDRYRVGAGLVALGLSVSDGLDLSVVARPILQRLRDALGHSCVVSRLETDGMRVLRTVLGTSLIEIGVRPGSLLTFHGSAQGKVALASSPEDLLERVQRARLPLLTPHTIVSPTALADEVARVRDQGWAVAPNESLVGVNTLAAPVFDGTGSCIGALGMNDSIQFIEARPTAEQIRLVREAAAEISREMGFRG